MTITLCPVTQLDVNDMQMILVQACGSDMREKVKYDGQEERRHEIASRRVKALAEALLKTDKNGVDVLYLGKELEWERIKDPNTAEAIAKRIKTAGKITNLAAGLKACIEKHKDYCANNKEHRLTTIVVLTSGKTSNHTLLNSEKEGLEELQKVVREVGDRCLKSGDAQLRVVFAPVAPGNEQLLSLAKICNPQTRQKLVATQIPLLQPLDRISVLKMATVYDRNKPEV